MGPRIRRSFDSIGAFEEVVEARQALAMGAHVSGFRP
jgi:hypothetical protein